MIDKYNLPTATATLLNRNVEKCQNLGLILDKYPPEHVVGASQSKGEWFRNILATSHVDETLVRSVYHRWLIMTTATGAAHFSAATDWRMVVGLGGETVLETDLTLHHLYGFPYIPGSALKGLTRAYAAGEVYPSTKIENDSIEIKSIFGTQDQAGTVIFFDAMPIDGKTAIVLDIMNVHYPNYYGEKKPPTNDQNPNPITFLTVANTTFMFALAPRNPNNNEHVKDVEQAKDWLQKALAKYGVGGKTSAGYGYFKDIHDQQAELLSTQTASSSIPDTTTQKSTERIRPNIPKFREGQEIRGAVIAATDQLRLIAPDAKAFLQYESFATKDVLMVVTAEEAANWKPGDTRICQFVREETQAECSLLICQPRPPKNKDKDKKKR